MLLKKQVEIHFRKTVQEANKEINRSGWQRERERERSGQITALWFPNYSMRLFIKRIDQTCPVIIQPDNNNTVWGLWSFILRSQRKPTRLLVFLLWDSTVRWPGESYTTAHVSTVSSESAIWQVDSWREVEKQNLCKEVQKIMAVYLCKTR